MRQGKKILDVLKEIFIQVSDGYDIDSTGLLLSKIDEVKMKREKGELETVPRVVPSIEVRNDKDVSEILSG